jgi:uncharacterized protein (TIGR00730 family)
MVRAMRSICVYCASSTGTNPLLAETATELGRLLATKGVDVVYGGGAVGLMGTVADAAMAEGGRVVGIIPSALMPAEVAHRGITELVEVASMHERKAAMIARSDGFIALPGGFGTLEEVAEVLTWAQLGLHDKPIGLLNVDGFYDNLLAFFDRCIGDGVLKQKNRDLLVVETTPAALVSTMEQHQPTHEPKWSDLEQI